jgi:glycosyltransferase involved in cell wall biosynthesis
MTRYAGIRDNNICIISDSIFNNSNLRVVEVPKSLDNISSAKLMSEFKFKGCEFKSKNIVKLASDLKVALVSNYGGKCGIATYSKFLFNELVGKVADYKIFAEKIDLPESGAPNINNDHVVQCWKRGGEISELVAAIKQYDPDIINIQHEFGIWPNARHWLSLMTQLSDYRVIITMHSVFPMHADKTIYEAAMPEIIVHLQGAKDCLKNEKKVNAKIYVIPHGCYPIKDQTKLWNNYRSQHTFITSGFGFQYKNFAESIKAAAILKSKYPDVFFTGLFSESPHNTMGHQAYYNELIKLIDDLNIHDNVAIIRGFQSDSVMNTYLRSNNVGVFPYISIPGHEVFGASGAARLAMASGIPIISTSIPHFSDMPTIKADTAEQIAKELDLLFSNPSLAKKQIELQNTYIKENSWETSAQRYINVFESSF